MDDVAQLVFGLNAASSHTEPTSSAQLRQTMTMALHPEPWAMTGRITCLKFLNLLFGGVSVTFGGPARY